MHPMVKYQSAKEHDGESTTLLRAGWGCVVGCFYPSSKISMGALGMGGKECLELSQGPVFTPAAGPSLWAPIHHA